MIERVLGHLAATASTRRSSRSAISPTPSGPPTPRAGGRHGLTYAVEPEPLDTAGAVRFAADFGRVAETFVVVNGDVLTDFDLSGLVDFHR